MGYGASSSWELNAVIQQEGLYSPIQFAALLEDNHYWGFIATAPSLPQAFSKPCYQIFQQSCAFHGLILEPVTDSTGV